MRAAIYARVSTEEQGQGTSLDTQQEACMKLAKEQGYEVTHIFTEAYTGLSRERPELGKLRELIRGNGIDALVCYSSDRLARDPVDLIILLDECQKQSVVPLFVTEDLDSSDVGKLITHIKGYAHKLEAEKIKERTTRGKRARADKLGKWNGGLLRYGYDYTSEPELLRHQYTSDTGRLQLNEQEAEVVRGMFEWVAEGKSAASWSRWANEQGIPTKRTSKGWTEHQVRATLHEIAYTGRGAYGKLTIRGNKRVKADNPVPFRYPQIIPEDLFAKVQARLAENIRLNKGSTKHTYILQHLGRCGVCGGPLGCRTLKPSVSYIGCLRQRLYPHEHNCHQPQYTRMALVERHVWGQIEEILDTYTDSTLDRLAVQCNGVEEQVNATIAKAQKELGRCSLERQRILTALRKHWATEAEADLQFRAIGADEEQWQEELAKAEASKANVSSVLEGIFRQIGRVLETRNWCWDTTMGFTPEQKKDILNALLDSFVLYGDDRLELRLKVPANEAQVVETLVTPLHNATPLHWQLLAAD